MAKSLVEIVEQLGLLKRKLEVYEQLKSTVGGLDEAENEVLLDLDAFGVAPLREEIERIEKAEVRINGRASTEKKPIRKAKQRKSKAGTAGVRRP